MASSHGFTPNSSQIWGFSHGCVPTSSDISMHLPSHIGPYTRSQHSSLWLFELSFLFFSMYFGLFTALKFYSYGQSGKSHKSHAGDTLSTSAGFSFD